jgi:tetratricopeptide (TPR) repeat protein
MNKQQLILIIGGLATIAGLYFFGPVVAPSKKPAVAAEADSAHNHGFDIDEYENKSIAALSKQRQQFIYGLKESVKRGDVKDQSIHINHQLARFWKDSVPNPLLHFNFTSKAAELENSEKSLTFAAHSILGYLPFAQNQEEQSWLAGKGKVLFEKALVLNPSNDSSIVGVGGCIIYGAAEGNEGTMAGIMKVREVAQRDSNNVFAQYMLGVGGLMSRQYDKAVLRFEKVVRAQPDNLEALFKLAEANELMGEKAKAVYWYEIISGKIADPEMKSAIAKRIEELKK